MAKKRRHSTRKSTRKSVHVKGYSYMRHGKRVHVKAHSRKC